MFLLRTMVGLQPENGFGGNSRMLFTTFAAPDHLCTYSSYSFRRSANPQGLWGLSAKPAEKSSRRWWMAGELQTRSWKRRLI